MEDANKWLTLVHFRNEQVVFLDGLVLLDREYCNQLAFKHIVWMSGTLCSVFGEYIDANELHITNEMLRYYGYCPADDILWDDVATILNAEEGRSDCFKYAYPPHRCDKCKNMED